MNFVELSLIRVFISLVDLLFDLEAARLEELTKSEEILLGLCYCSLSIICASSFFFIWVKFEIYCCCTA